MKLSYVLQLKDFSIMFGLGVFLGIIYGILNMYSYVKKIFFIQIISDIFFTIIAFCIFIYAINKINLGEFRLFLLIGYLLGFFVERITLGKIFAKGFKYVYTILVNKLKQFTKSKFGRIIFK